MVEPLIHAEIPFVPMTLSVPGPDTEIILLSVQPLRPSVFTAQILFAAESVRTQVLHTVAPVELFLRYTNLAGVTQNVSMSRIARLPFNPLAMRGRQEGFIATEASPLSLCVRFSYPIQDTTKTVHFHAFVAAVLRQQTI
jgi:hypothetical protein